MTAIAEISVHLDLATLQEIPAMMRAAARPVLMRFGAFVWQRARTSIVPSKRPSQPGNPPHTHQNTLPKSIRFAYDDETVSVVVGPIPLPGKTGTAPTALEVGGATQEVAKRKGVQVIRTSNIKARPFMGPAPEAELSNLPPLWANSIKGT